MTAPLLNEDRRPEIIIVRRKKIGDDGHHGGAWKIAFADFMTAMMALFLVLWLVNAANEETRKAVASYFNPVKLVDRHRSERGLSAVDGPSRKKDQPRDGADVEVETEDPPHSQEETRFREDPAEIIEEIARLAKLDVEFARSQPVVEPDVFRDPFQNPLLAPVDTPIEPPFANKAKEGESTAEPNFEVERAADRTKPENSQPAEAEDREDTDPADAEVLEAELTQALSDGGEAAPVEMRDTPEGTLISVMETPAFPLFRSGSAIPEGKLVLLLETLGETLKGKDGGLEIYGHTDATPFAREDYDNWRLSTDRAHSTRLMLLRSGLQEGRISAVTGYAASRPIEGRERDDPINRRIEILLRRT